MHANLCMCMYMCMYACIMYLCMYVYVCTCMYVCMSVCKCDFFQNCGFPEIDGTLFAKFVRNYVCK